MQNKEKEEIYAAIKLIENIFKQGLIKQHIFKNILEEYKDRIDTSEFKCYN
jgi:hypothetical protein